MTASAIHQSLLIICQQLDKKGIKPTASLIKAKASFNVSIADAIAAVRAFHSNEESTPNNPPRTTPDPLKRISELESRVADLEAALVRIEKQLHDQG